MYYPFRENEGTDQLCNYCTDDLRLCFCIGKNLIIKNMYVFECNDCDVHNNSIIAVGSFLHVTQPLLTGIVVTQLIYLTNP